jgi:sugar phosphate isomerase/epimerase
MKMLLGICTSVDRLPIAQQAGFDYLELPATALAAMTKEQVSALCSRPEIKIRSCNGLLPPDIRLNGRDFSPEKLKTYLDDVFEKANRLKIDTFVLGCGTQRRIAETDNWADCVKQFEEAAWMVAEKAAMHQLTIVLEPLNHRETNLIHTLSDGAALVRKLNHPHLRLMADCYHMFVEAEPLSEIARYADLIAHIHIANPQGRVIPKPGDGTDYRPLFDLLKQIGYQHKVSIEAGSEDFAADSAAARQYLSGMI